MVLPALPAVAAAAAPAAASAVPAAATSVGMGAVGANLAAELISGLLLNKIPQAVTGAAQSVAGAPPVDTAGFNPAGKYFLGTEPEAAYLQFLSKEVPRRALLNYLSEKITGNKVFPDLPSSKEFMEEALARQTFQARDLTEREIAKIRAEKEYDYMARALEAQAGVRKQELSSLGDIQRQRVESSYNAAQGMLSDALKNIVARENLADSDVLRQLATPV